MKKSELTKISELNSRITLNKNKRLIENIKKPTLNQVLQMETNKKYKPDDKVMTFEDDLIDNHHSNNNVNSYNNNNDINNIDNIIDSNENNFENVDDSIENNVDNEDDYLEENKDTNLLCSNLMTKVMLTTGDNNITEDDLDDGMAYDCDNENNSSDEPQQIIQTLIPAFSIVTDCEDILKSIVQFQLPADNLQKINPNDDNSITKGDFAREFDSILKQNAISSSGETDLFNFMLKHFKQYDLPVKLTRNKKMYESILKKYKEPGVEYKSYDICRDGCCVYVGMLSDAKECPICKNNRYRDTISGLEKTAYKRLYYKPIIPLICLLLAQPGFLIALNYKYQFGSEKNRKDFKFTDISDGITYKKNLDAMNLNYNRKYSNRVDVINVPILFSEFFDGVQIRTTKVSLLFIYYHVQWQIIGH
jgi:hypothetical protein